MTGLVSIAFLMGLTGLQEIVTQAQVHGYVPSCDGTRGTPRKYTGSDVPCDIDEKSYCTELGDAYPKQAVRQFVTDNQGLMRRMYGDLRHLSVLRSEMNWDDDANDVQKEIDGPTSGVDDERMAELKGRDSPASEESDTANATTTTTTTSESSARDSTSTATVVPSSVISPPVSSEYKMPTLPDNEKVKEKPEKGISACPTKKEVVAPYWAVNTRGRTLAIVNDPPYEQHIHWEKCLHENQQMLCRDGCKCEQLQRLQRLLAFDPNCDCKGVFMDWFLLPSCCVCKCYGLTYGNLTSSSSSASGQNATAGRRTGRQRTTWNETDDDEKRDTN